MVRLFVAMVAGAVLAGAATFITGEVVSGVSTGTPTNQTLYNYGTR